MPDATSRAAMAIAELGLGCCATFNDSGFYRAAEAALKVAAHRELQAMGPK